MAFTGLFTGQYHICTAHALVIRPFESGCCSVRLWSCPLTGLRRTWTLCQRRHLRKIIRILGTTMLCNH